MRYMTVKDILDYVDEVKQNTFSRKTKLIWLNELEYRVQTDVMLLSAEGVQTIPDDDTHQLLVPVPWSEIYYDYLFMKLSEHLEESSEQNNRAATFNKAFTRFMRWWADTYNPSNGKALFRGYYLKGDKGDKGGPFVYDDFTAEQLASLKGADGKDGTFRINVTYSDGVYSADKTFSEIKAAYDAGQQPFVVLTGGTFDLVYTLANFDAPTDGSEPKFVDFERYLVGDGILETEMLRVYSYTTDSGSNVVKRIDEFKMPTSLKNPNALTFTGGATGSYDGSEPETVHIPVIPYEVINKNTAARHSHDNKTVLDGITAEKVTEWDSKNSITDSGGYFTSDTVEGALQEIGAGLAHKQDKLVAGDNITIGADGKTISATGGGSTIELDTTLTQSGKAADAKAVGDALADKQPIGDYATSGELNALAETVDGKADAADIPSLEGYATEAYVQNYHDNTKQDIITDLATIRSGASKGATAVQPEAGKGLFSGSYNDLTDKPTIPDAVTEGTVSGWGFTKNTGTYSKPAGGIPKSDLAAAVQTSLGKADTALQEHQSLAAYRKAAAQDAIDAQKQSIITDLETIRSGAAKGATALQSVPATYRTAAAQDVIDNTKLTDAPTDGKAYARKNGSWHEIAVVDVDALQSKSITDSGGHFTTDTVEGALQEIGAELAGINTLLGSGIQISFTIDDGGSNSETFSVVSGTTWAEWIGTGRLIFNDSLVLYIYGGVVATEAGVYAVSLDGSTAVSGGDEIISGATYTIINWGG